MQLIIFSILYLKYMGLYQHTPYVPYTFRHLVRFTYHKNTYQYRVKIVKMHSVIIMMVV